TIQKITGGFPCIVGVTFASHVRNAMTICKGKADAQVDVMLQEYNISAPTRQMIDGKKPHGDLYLE
ncbi:hypothetical protein SK128_011945, partial [Halocaridina rubra]